MSTNEMAINDPGGVRRLFARWIITGEIVLRTAAHFGGTGDDLADMMVLRDPREGLPLLPGSSLAGALRNYLADVLGGYESDEHPDVASLFGARRSEGEGDQSPLIVFDGIGTLPDSCSIEIRDGVAIDGKTGIAEAHKKFDYEVLPAGTMFPLRVELLILDPQGEASQVSLLLSALSGLAEGQISIGARRSRGLGSIAAGNWRAVRHDLTQQKGWLDWLTSDAKEPIADSAPVHNSVLEACASACPSLLLGLEQVDRRRRLVIEAEIQSNGGVLVRSRPATGDAPDAVHLKSAGCSVLPGTSLAGVLRAHAGRIARFVRSQHGDAEMWIDGIFGSPSRDTETADSQPVASRLRVSENIIKGGTRLRPSRIQIDRFTQGVVDGALFDEEPDYQGLTTVRLELRTPTPGEPGLLLLLAKDFLDGHIPVGGASSVGRGTFTGTASVRFEDGTKTIRLDRDGGLQRSETERLDAEITAFHEATARNSTVEARE